MKLRNRKTGENYETTMPIVFNIKTSDGGEHTVSCESIKELNEKWEDYEEPKEYWYYDTTKNGIEKITHLEDKEKDQAIGNYFETKEETEKAVEKLKAWKRLKDNGISFKVKVIDRKWYLEPKAEPQQRTFDDTHNIYKDIMFIFGGEE